ncbi:SDR family NAD(P)-dependent oxidoreductase [Tolypothrix sp. VBCCA 56010]|uniref:SDR family NAD(P)-dependent oxidoreductase n=1 Tax=Tolypothrix sp. VBCCA 56010 TaxID=3137731 RepID=UPI003D7D269F
MTANTQTQKQSSDTKLLQDRVVLVTGAGRGIGAATAKLLASHGAAVGVNYYSSEAAAQEVVDEITTNGGKAIAIKGDVTQMSEVESLVKQVTEAFGAIDTLILNANASFAIAPFVDHKWEDFEAKLLGELKGAFYPCKAVVPSMIEHKRGCIIAVSSVAARYASEGFISHSTAKSGLDGFVKSLALELGPHNIRVNAIAPGLIETDTSALMPQEWKDNMAQMVPLRRNGQPEDVAGAILLMASEQARFITGTYLLVNGGLQMI